VLERDAAPLKRRQRVDPDWHRCGAPSVIAQRKQKDPQLATISGRGEARENGLPINALGSSANQHSGFPTDRAP
jgi:hypothetical protein